MRIVSVPRGGGPKDVGPCGSFRQVLVRSAAFVSWRLLVHQKGRFAASAVGVAFALLLMILQLDFRSALLDSSTELLREMDADALVIRSDKLPFLSRKRMPSERLYQAQSAEGVPGVRPHLDAPALFA